MTGKIRMMAITAALAMTAGTAQAQLVRFTTAGAFSGTGCTSVALTLTSTSCSTLGGVVLSYAFGDQQVLNGFGNAQFGTFTTTGTGPSTFNDVLFSLTVNQSTPTIGSALSSAPVYGTVSAIQGGLIWGPVSPTTFSIGQVAYTLSTDAITGGVRIDPPGEGGSISSPQTIRGFVSTVPEPASGALMVAGLAALTFVSRRRRAAV